MRFLHPGLLWLAFAAPLVVLALAVWAARRRRRALAALGDGALVARLVEDVRPGRRAARTALVVAGVALVAFALAGPRFGLARREVRREGVDLVIALDVSRSMLAEDVAPSRLVRARAEMNRLLDRLDGDRVGLVLFAGDAFVQCPLTTDYGAVRLFLDAAAPEMLPTPGSDFDAALDAALDAFEPAGGGATAGAPGPSRVVLFVSDGENHAPGADAAAERAREAGVVVLAVGVGEADGAEIPTYEDGRRAGSLRDASGAVVRTRLEAGVLRRLAVPDGYFHIGRTASDVERVPARLAKLTQADRGQDVFETYAERYGLPLALGLLLLLAEPLVGDGRRKPRARALKRP